MDGDIETEIENLSAKINSYIRSGGPRELVVTYRDLQKLQRYLDGETVELTRPESEEILERYSTFCDSLDHSPERKIAFIAEFESVIGTAISQISDNFQDKIENIGRPPAGQGPEELDSFESDRLSGHVERLLNGYADVVALLQFIDGDPEPAVELEESQQVLAIYKEFKRLLPPGQMVDLIRQTETQLDTRKEKIRSRLLDVVELEVIDRDGQDLEVIAGLETRFERCQVLVAVISNDSEVNRGMKNGSPWPGQALLEEYQSASPTPEESEELWVDIRQKAEQCKADTEQRLRQEYARAIQKQLEELSTTVIQGGAEPPDDIGHVRNVCDTLQQPRESTFPEATIDECESTAAADLLEILSRAWESAALDDDARGRLLTLVQDHLDDLGDPLVEGYSTQLIQYIDDYPDDVPTTHDDPAAVIRKLFTGFDAFQAQVDPGRDFPPNTSPSKLNRFNKTVRDAHDALSPADFETVEIQVREAIQKHREEARTEYYQASREKLETRLGHFNKHANDVTLVDGYRKLAQLLDEEQGDPTIARAESDHLEKFKQEWQAVKRSYESGSSEYLSEEQYNRLRQQFKEDIEGRREDAQARLYTDWNEELTAALNGFADRHAGESEKLVDGYTRLAKLLDDQASDPQFDHDDPDSLQEFESQWKEVQKQYRKNRLREQDFSDLKEQLKARIEDRLTEAQEKLRESYIAQLTTHLDRFAETHANDPETLVEEYDLLRDLVSEERSSPDGMRWLGTPEDITSFRDSWADIKKQLGDGADSSEGSFADLRREVETRIEDRRAEAQKTIHESYEEELTTHLDEFAEERADDPETLIEGYNKAGAIIADNRSPPEFSLDDSDHLERFENVWENAKDPNYLREDDRAVIRAAVEKDLDSRMADAREDLAETFRQGFEVSISKFEQKFRGQHERLVLGYDAMQRTIGSDMEPHTQTSSTDDRFEDIEEFVEEFAGICAELEDEHRVRREQKRKIRDSVEDALTEELEKARASLVDGYQEYLTGRIEKFEENADEEGLTARGLTLGYLTFLAVLEKPDLDLTGLLSNRREIRRFKENWQRTQTNLPERHEQIKTAVQSQVDIDSFRHITARQIHSFEEAHPEPEYRIRGYRTFLRLLEDPETDLEANKYVGDQQTQLFKWGLKIRDWPAEEDRAEVIESLEEAIVDKLKDTRDDLRDTHETELTGHLDEFARNAEPVTRVKGYTALLGLLENQHDFADVTFQHPPLEEFTNRWTTVEQQVSDGVLCEEDNTSLGSQFKNKIENRLTDDELWNKFIERIEASIEQFDQNEDEPSKRVRTYETLLELLKLNNPEVDLAGDEDGEWPEMQALQLNRARINQSNIRELRSTLEAKHENAREELQDEWIEKLNRVIDQFVSSVRTIEMSPGERERQIEKGLRTFTDYLDDPEQHVDKGRKSPETEDFRRQWVEAQNSDALSEDDREKVKRAVVSRIAQRKRTLVGTDPSLKQKVLDLLNLR